MSFLSKIFKSRNDRVLSGYHKRLRAIKDRITRLTAYHSLDLKQEASKLRKESFTNGDESSLEDRAIALFFLAMQREMNITLHDSQIKGALALMGGKIAEMPTGEGKTFTAALAAFTVSITGRKVHIITVNDYLASRDAKLMSKVFDALDTVVAFVTSDTPDGASKQAAYQANILYITNSVLGFDYLRDNLAVLADQCVNNPFAFAIVDEADSVLIDEAGTPLIISGDAVDWSEVFVKVKAACVSLVGDIDGNDEDPSVDFYLKPADKDVFFTNSGYAKLEKTLLEQGLIPDEAGVLYRPQFSGIMQFVKATVLAEHLYEKDRDYAVVDNKVCIIDDFTGRLMPDRRWSDGIHQAIELKEGVKLEPVAKTLASITYQNLFGMYDTLSGMTGTADTDARELHEVYGVEVIVIPSAFESKRHDNLDRFYLTRSNQYEAVVEEVGARHGKGQPILIGTTHVEASEQLSLMLTDKGLHHEVLNAKNPSREAEIIAGAGAPFAITIATNMAGRGTDIVLGGDKKNLPEPTFNENRDKVIKSGGLHVIGVERNDARRIDNQLRGRSGRQGDPGSTQFFLSADDRLISLFFAKEIKEIFNKIDKGDDPKDYLQNGLLSSMTDKAQRKMEQHSFEARKDMLDYDDVQDQQRTAVYSMRRKYMSAVDLSDNVEEIVDDLVKDMVESCCPQGVPDEAWSLATMDEWLDKTFMLAPFLVDWHQNTGGRDEGLNQQVIFDITKKAIMTNINERKSAVLKAFNEGRVTISEYQDPHKAFLWYLSFMYLQTLDTAWKGHLKDLDGIRMGIHLRSYANKDPKQEFKKEAFLAYQEMLHDVEVAYVSQLSRLKVTVGNQKAA